MSPVRIDQCDPARMNVKYAVILAGLLLLIIAVLGQLWLIERNRRADAEGRLVELYLKERVLEAANAVGLPQAGDQRIGPVRRQELPTRTVNWNGQDKVVLLVGGRVGQAMGLEMGDVIMVTEEAAAASPPIDSQPSR